MSNFPLISKPTFKAAVAAVAVAVKAGPCSVQGWLIQNGTAALAYVQVFDVAQASVIVGTTVPDWVIPVPASGQAPFHPGSFGIPHGTALTVACTTTPGGAVGAACDVLMFVR